MHDDKPPAALWRKIETLARRYCAMIIRDKLEREEVAEMVTIKVFEKRQSIRHLPAYVRQAVYRHAMDYKTTYPVQDVPAKQYHQIDGEAFIQEHQNIALILYRAFFFKKAILEIEKLKGRPWVYAHAEELHNVFKNTRRNAGKSNKDNDNLTKDHLCQFKEGLRGLEREPTPGKTWTNFQQNDDFKTNKGGDQ